MELAVFSAKLKELGFVFKDNKFVYSFLELGPRASLLKVELGAPRKICVKNTNTQVVFVNYYHYVDDDNNELDNCNVSEQLPALELGKVFEWLQKKDFYSPKK